MSGDEMSVKPYRIYCRSERKFLHGSLFGYMVPMNGKLKLDSLQLIRMFPKLLFVLSKEGVTNTQSLEVVISSFEI